MAQYVPCSASRTEKQPAPGAVDLDMGWQCQDRSTGCVNSRCCALVHRCFSRLPPEPIILRFALQRLRRSPVSFMAWKGPRKI
uniref:Uncharacterized protein n=1 Tax=Anopheles funestus TaxID=62324 RepID=A0A182S2G7_ANOFN